MDTTTCPYCSGPLMDVTVTVGHIGFPTRGHGTLYGLYFNEKGKRPQALLSSWDEKSALRCASCDVLILNRSNTEVPIGRGEKAYAKNRLDQLQNLMRIFSSQKAFEAYMKYQERSQFYEEYLASWDNLLSEETVSLL